MKSILTIKDLAQDTVLGRKDMAAVRGGQGDQANGVSQGNVLTAFAPVNVGNGSLFYGCGPVSIQSDSKVDQTASNTNDSANLRGLFGIRMPQGC